MKKTILVTSFILIVLSFTGCEQQTPEPVINEIESEIPASVRVKMPSFDQPLGWQIISMTDVDLIEPYKNSAEETFGTEVLGYRSTEINFDRPHDIGPYGRTVDIQIQDFIFETPPATPEEYLAKLETAWGSQGEKENHTSPSGLEFVTWLGQSPAYEADMVLYVTEYTDGEGEKHFVEISRMGVGHETIKAVLKPLVDSLK